jgi:tRNA(Ile)-lysidine synthase
MIEQVYQCLKQTGMIQPGERVAAAVSGGADSVALLEVLAGLRERLGIALAVAHLNHRLRGAESEADARFVEQLAARHGLPFFHEARDVAAEARRQGANLEAVARALRYSFLRELVESGRVSKVATGHTADDQAETVLARLLRGSGTRGLAGIYPVVDGWLVRPLLEQRRAELRAWLTEQQLSWREDSSNRDLRLTRNRLRGAVLPLLEQFNPRLVQQLAATAEIARDEEEYWNQRVPELLEHVRVQGSKGPRVQGSTEGRQASVMKLDLPRFVQLHRAEQRRLLRAALAQAGCAGAIDIAQVESLRRLATSGTSGQSLLFSGLRAVRVFNSLELRRGRAADAEDYEFQVGVPGACAIPATGTRLLFDLVGRDACQTGYNIEEELLDFGCVQTPLVVRNWRPGDVFESSTGRGVRKIKTLLLRRRIPADERRGWPVVVSGRDVVWVRGFPVARSFRWRASSQTGILIREEPAAEEQNGNPAD